VSYTAMNTHGHHQAGEQLEAQLAAWIRTLPEAIVQQLDNHRWADQPAQAWRRLKRTYLLGLRGGPR
jgi:hypothetical protein